MITKEKEAAREFIADLFMRNYGKIMSMVAKDYMCRPMAEDVVQEVFYEAVRKPDKVLEHENPEGWLMEVAKFKMLELKKRLYARSAHETEDVEQELWDMENEYGLVEIQMILDAAMGVHDKTLFLMYYLEGYSSKELAEREGISEVAFRVRIHRIKDRILKELREKESGRRRRK